MLLYLKFCTIKSNNLLALEHAAKQYLENLGPLVTIIPSNINISINSISINSINSISNSVSWELKAKKLYKVGKSGGVIKDKKWGSTTKMRFHFGKRWKRFTKAYWNTPKLKNTPPHPLFFSPFEEVSTSMCNWELIVKPKINKRKILCYGMKNVIVGKHLNQWFLARGLGTPRGARFDSLVRDEKA